MAWHGNRVSGKEQPAFTSFYEMYASKLWGIIRLAKLPTAQSEHILINTLKKAWQTLSQPIQSAEPTFSWLLTLAYREGLPKEDMRTFLQPQRPTTPINAVHLQSCKSVPVLIAGCTQDDQELLAQSLNASKLRVNVTFTSKTDQVLPHLQATSPDTDNFPRLLLLNAEGSDGQTNWQLLQQIKASYRQLPIVIISTDQHGDTALQAYDLGVNSVLIKSFDLEEWKKTLATLADYWLTIVSLPIQQRK